MKRCIWKERVAVGFGSSYYVSRSGRILVGETLIRHTDEELGEEGISLTYYRPNLDLAQREYATGI
jgi:hypothetical protein